MREDLARGAVKHDATVVEHEDAPAALGERGHLLLDDHHGDALTLVEVAQRVKDHPGRRGVQCGGGLVEHEHARAQRQHGGDGDLLLLAAGEGRDLAVAQLGYAHRVERRGEACLDLVSRHAKVLEPKSPKSSSSSTTEATIWASMSWLTLPTTRETSVSVTSQVSCPSTITAPKSLPRKWWGIAPERAAASVDLPAPEGPRTPTNSPSAMERETLSRARASFSPA